MTATHPSAARNNCHITADKSNSGSYGLQQDTTIGFRKLISPGNEFNWAKLNSRNSRILTARHSATNFNTSQKIAKQFAFANDDPAPPTTPDTDQHPTDHHGPKN
jgi:hypothetical protein